MTEQQKETEQASSIKDTKLEIRRVYVKDLSFESPQVPNAFSGGENNPAIDVQMGVDIQQLDEKGVWFEVVLTITVTAKTGENVLFLNEVQQAGVFEIHGFSDEETVLVLNIACPNILLPFARAVITDIVAKGGFPQLLINPVNFEVLYSQKMQRAQAEQSKAEGSVPGNGEPPQGASIN